MCTLLKGKDWNHVIYSLTTKPNFSPFCHFCYYKNLVTLLRASYVPSTTAYISNTIYDLNNQHQNRIDLNSMHDMAVLCSSCLTLMK